jgi:capsular exopolysaccharide synthesis family protein
MSIWAAFRRRWQLAVGVGLVLGVLAGAGAWIATLASSYSATTTLRVNARQPTILFPDTSAASNFENYQRSQVAFVKSRMVLTLALHEPKVSQLALVQEQADAVEWLEKLLQVDFASSPEILRISVSGKDQEALLVLVGAIRDVYLREIVNAESKERDDRLQKIQKLYMDYVDELKKKRKVLDELANDVGSGNPKVLVLRQEAALKQLSDIQHEFTLMQSKVNMMKIEAVAKAKGAERALQDPISPLDIEDAIAKDSLLVNHKNEIERLKKKLELYKQRSTNPTKEDGYISDSKLLESTLKAAEARTAELRPQVEKDIRQQRLNKIQRELEDQNQQLKLYEDLESMLQKDIDNKANSIQDLGKKGHGLEAVKEDIELADAMAKRAGGAQEAIRVELDAPARITKMDEPYIVKRDGMGIKAGGIAALVGFLVGALAVALLEFWSRRVSDLTEVSRGLNLPVMGTLPLVQTRQASATERQGHPANEPGQESMIESVDAARTVLLHAFRQKNLRVVMVTSAGAGEGKTLLSAHLSISLSRAGWRILLIDGDLRRPTLHKVFGIENVAGLGQVLRGEANLSEIIRPATGELSLITAGHADQQSLRGLAQGELGRLFDELKKNYDFIILDSAPVLPVADAQLMAQAADGVILSVLQNVSRLPFVYAAYERLMLLHANLLGVVLHGKSFGAYGSHYSYQPLDGTKAAPTKAGG